MKVDTNDYVIFPDKKKMIFDMLSLWFILVLGAISIIITFIGESNIFNILLLRLAGIILIAFFCLVLITTLLGLISKKPAFIITDEYIYDNASYIGAGEIKLKEIKNVYIYKHMDQKYLGIKTHDPDLVISKKRGLKKFLLKMNKKFVDAQISVSERAVSITLEEIRRIIIEKMKKN